MNPKLPILIQELEAEEIRLKRLMEEAIAEENYLHAHFHSIAKEQLTFQIQTLKKLENAQIKLLHQDIEILKSSLKQAKDDKLMDNFLDKILANEKEIQRIKEINIHQNKHNSTLKHYFDQFATGNILG